MQCIDEPCFAEKITTRQTIQQEKLAKEKLIRRSTRDPNVSVLDRHDLAVLLNKIEKNHPSTVILKIKNHIQADINSAVFDAIIEALWKNRVCQVLSNHMSLHINKLIHTIFFISFSVCISKTSHVPLETSSFIG